MVNFKICILLILMLLSIANLICLSREELALSEFGELLSSIDSVGKLNNYYVESLQLQQRPVGDDSVVIDKYMKRMRRVYGKEYLDKIVLKKDFIEKLRKTAEQNSLRYRRFNLWHYGKLFRIDQIFMPIDLYDEAKPIDWSKSETLINYNVQYKSKVEIQHKEKKIFISRGRSYASEMEIEMMISSLDIIKFSVATMIENPTNIVTEIILNSKNGSEDVLSATITSDSDQIKGSTYYEFSVGDTLKLTKWVSYIGDVMISERFYSDWRDINYRDKSFILPFSQEANYYNLTNELLSRSTSIDLLKFENLENSAEIISSLDRDDYDYFIEENYNYKPIEKDKALSILNE